MPFFVFTNNLHLNKALTLEAKQQRDIRFCYFVPCMILYTLCYYMPYTSAKTKVKSTIKGKTTKKVKAMPAKKVKATKSKPW